ncbi:MAG: hypothetical protein OEY36_07720 [Gammaproteobacteria bacterium]|nr:hypothetical protein [Gammaproteobacteria bacterium]
MVKQLKRIVFKSYVIGLMIFTVWYGYFMFPLIFGFEGKEDAAASIEELSMSESKEDQMFDKLIAEQTHRKQTDLGYRLIDQPYMEGRFHHIGFNIQKDNASTCVQCHGNVPHDESREIRSFLNMHTFYLACETCHSMPDKDSKPWLFKWYDKDSGKIAHNPKDLIKIEDLNASKDAKRQYPVYGNYGAKIAPAENDSGEIKFLHGKKEMAFAQSYKTKQDLLTPEKKSQMKRVIHRKVSKKPVQCKQCHQEDQPYISFAELGYPPSRVKELTNVGAVGMIEKYKTFYMPALLKPGGAELDK